MEPVEFTCMTYKKKFVVEDPLVIRLKNGRHAFKAPCPWRSSTGRILYAYKFCSVHDYEAHRERNRLGCGFSDPESE